jgi:hypothetical protein
MATINFRKESAQKLDIEKRKLESSIIVELRKVFKNMSIDAANLFRATGTVPVGPLADNYRPDFTKSVRDALRKSVKKFGFDIRDDIQKKHNLDFNIELKRALIGLNIKQKVTLEDDNADEKLEAINTQFQVDATTFVANESEEQVEMITETNKAQISAAIIAATGLYSQDLSKLETDRAEIINELIVAPPKKTPKLERQLTKINNEIEAFSRNRQAIIAENLETNLIDKSKARSELIAAQNVGLGESYARDTEARLIEDANLVAASGEPVRLKKEWLAILDSKTRPAHVRADGQQVGLNEPYIVDGESLRFPRDPLGSAKNVINCRCISDYNVE